jgi:hypothetical protein
VDLFVIQDGQQAGDDHVAHVVDRVVLRFGADHGRRLQVRPRQSFGQGQQRPGLALAFLAMHLLEAGDVRAAERSAVASTRPAPPTKGAPQAPSHLWRWRGGGLGLLRHPPADSLVDPVADATVIAHVEMHHVAVGRTPAEAYPFDEFLLEVHETGLA